MRIVRYDFEDWPRGMEYILRRRGMRVPRDIGEWKLSIHVLSAFG